MYACLGTPFASRTLARKPLVISKTILTATRLSLTSDTSPAGSVPREGGGTANIASLTGARPPTGGSNASNASAHVVTTTFWIEQVRGEHGEEFTQMQYTQRVLLHFNGLSWPHITVATLRPVSAPSGGSCSTDLQFLVTMSLCGLWRRFARGV
jgi:hypothetical protein